LRKNLRLYPGRIDFSNENQTLFFDKQNNIEALSECVNYLVPIFKEALMFKKLRLNFEGERIIKQLNRKELLLGIWETIHAKREREKGVDADKGLVRIVEEEGETNSHSQHKKSCSMAGNRRSNHLPHVTMNHTANHNHWEQGGGNNYLPIVLALVCAIGREVCVAYDDVSPLEGGEGNEERKMASDLLYEISEDMLKTITLSKLEEVKQKNAVLGELIFDHPLLFCKVRTHVASINGSLAGLNLTVENPLKTSSSFYAPIMVWALMMALSREMDSTYLEINILNTLPDTEKVRKAGRLLMAMRKGLFTPLTLALLKWLKKKSLALSRLTFEDGEFFVRMQYHIASINGSIAGLRLISRHVLKKQKMGSLPKSSIDSIIWSLMNVMSQEVNATHLKIKLLKRAEDGHVNKLLIAIREDMWRPFTLARLKNIQKNHLALSELTFGDLLLPYHVGNHVAVINGCLAGLEIIGKNSFTPDDIHVKYKVYF